MRKILFILILLMFQSLPIFADESSNVLDRADLFFNSLAQGSYQTAWSLLSKKSKSTIIGDITDSYKKEKMTPPSKSELADDFEKCGEVCGQYWSGFMVAFQPKEILDNSEWTVSQVKKDYAEIRIRNNKSTKPAIVRMYKEGGQWQLGLTESFWLRKYFQD